MIQRSDPKTWGILLLLCSCYSHAQGGYVAIAPTVVARFDNATNFTPLPFTPQPVGGPAFWDGPGLYQIDLALRTTNLAPNERGFASLAFNVVLGSGMTVGFDYAPDSSLVDSNGGVPGGIVAKWTTNIDAGLPADYQGFLLAGPGSLFANPNVDPRGTLGDPDAEYFGSLFVNVTFGGSSISFDNYQFSMRDLSTGQFFLPQDGIIRPISPFGNTPGVAGKTVSYVQQLSPTTVVETLSLFDVLPEIGEWSLEQFDSPNGLQATVDPVTGQFSWLADGSPEGLYLARIGYTAPDGAYDEGTLRINWTVPEPASGVLVWMALVFVLTLRPRALGTVAFST